MEALATLMKGRTSIVIAHRLDTIRQADAIFVIDDCRLAESGTHDALMAKQGVYAGLYEIQNREPATIGDPELAAVPA
jgi:ABC-type multidrug transport system fused ATPase/permease subunit